MAKTASTSASPLLDTYEQLPFYIASGDGVYVFDESGKRYLDLYGGHAVSLLGHNPRSIVNAIREQSDKLFFYSNIAPLRIREDAARSLARIVWETLRHIFFCNSGAEANDNALKLAIRLTGREKLIAYSGSFHGRSLLCTAVTDAPKTHQELQGWCGDRVSFLKPNELEMLNQITEEHAAVILEPIQSMSGVVTFTSEYLHAVRNRCSEVGALLIFDEVQTGFGRTGLPFISGFGGIVPDIFTTAKGIASGYPVGAMFVHDVIAEKVKTGDLGSTYGAGPVAMAAVQATVNTLIEENLFEHVESLQPLWDSFVEIPGVEQVRGRGCLIGIKTKRDGKELSKKLLDHKIITGTCKDPSVLRLLPPITLQHAHIDQFKTALREALSA